MPGVATTSGAGARAILSSEVLKDFRYLKVLSRFLFYSPEMTPVFELINGATHLSGQPRPAGSGQPPAI